MIIKRSSSEVSNFIKTLGISPDDMPIPTFIQDDIVKRDLPKGRKIFIYWGGATKLELPTQTDAIETIRLSSVPPACCTDIYSPKASKRSYWMGDVIVAYVDTHDNLHFIDFIHDKGGISFVPFFLEILEREGINMTESLLLMRFRTALAKEFPENLVKILLDFARKEVQEFHNLQVSALREHISRLEERGYNKEMWKGILLGVSLKGWEAEGNALCYKMAIKVKKIKYKNVVVPASGNYYIEGLKVFINSEGIEAYCEKSYHPNATSGGDVCLGDLKDVSKVGHLPEMLETANLDSCYDNDATNSCKREWEEKTTDNKINSQVFDLTMFSTE